MREIKFRAWDKACNTMIDSSDKGSWKLYLDGGSAMDGVWSSRDFELMQFTGLTDKNGKDIYEGDIIKRKKNCLWDEGFVNEAVVFKNGFFGCSGPLVNLTDSFEPEVIGNIHENPELMEV